MNQQAAARSLLSLFFSLLFSVFVFLREHNLFLEYDKEQKKT
jgi:hypothetical protein